MNKKTQILLKKRILHHTPKLKVALLLFGQPRNIDNPDVYDSYKKHIIDIYNTDVFCHFWHDTYALTYDINECANLHYKNNYVVRNAVEIIKNTYNPKAFIYENPQKFSLDDNHKNILIKHFSHIKWLTNNTISNNISQMYSIYKVKQIYEEYIKTHNEHYDFVILGRYDMKIHNFPNLNYLNDNTFYLSNHHPHFPDLIFIFSNKFINFMDTYKNINKIITENEKYFNNNDIFWEPSVECFKYANYRLYYNISLLKPILLNVG